MIDFRVIDVGSEWRTFSNEKGGEDRSRVGGPENTLLGSSDLTTMIGKSNVFKTKLIGLHKKGLFKKIPFMLYLNIAMYIYC